MQQQSKSRRLATVAVATLTLGLATAASAQQPPRRPPPDTAMRDTTRRMQDTTRRTQDRMQDTTRRMTSTGEVANDAAFAGVVASLKSDANAVALLHESNVGEIQAGTLAQQSARDSAVRAFAERMVREHTTLDERGTALAQQNGVTPALPDSTLPQMQAAELRTLSGAEFDRAYVDHQVMAHRRTLALVDAAIARGSNAALKTALQSEVRPAVAEHLEMAVQLQQRLGGR